MKKILKKLFAYTLIASILTQTVGVYALTKEESVYVKLKETGEINEVSVSEHLYDYASKTIKDKSILNDIKNIDGNSSFKTDDDGIVWETKGDNIYYQGTYNKTLPIDVSVKYYLDGEEKNVKDMLGKKGKVKIVLTYTNNSFKYMKINGKTEKIYVPYAVVTTSILNNIDNKNISVINGKIIDNGIGSTVVAIASPGLYESLKVDELKNLDKVEITYDTDNFELSSIYSVATTDLFNNTSFTDAFGKVNDLYKNINLLQSNMDTIVSESHELSSGANQMNEAITVFNNKVQSVTDKYKHIRTADKEELKSEFLEALKEYISKVAPELKDKLINDINKILKKNNKELEKSLVNYVKDSTKLTIDEEISKIIDKLNINTLVAKVLNSNLHNILNNDEEIKELAATLKSNMKTELNKIINQVVNEVNNSLDDGLDEEYINSLAEKYGVTYDQALKIASDVQTNTINNIKHKIDNANISEKVVSLLDKKDYLNALINSYIDLLNEKLSDYLGRDTTISEYASELKEKILDEISNDLENGNIFANLNTKEYIDSLIDKIIEKTSNDLTDKYSREYIEELIQNIIDNDFYKDDINSKIKELISTIENIITEKINRVDNAVYNLSDSLNKLNDGSNKLAFGMDALSKGLEKYNKQGINKLTKLVNGDVKAIEKRIEAMSELSKENSIIDESVKDTKTSSKIVFMIDSMSKPVEHKEEIKTNNKKLTLWDKIIGLFK